MKVISLSMEEEKHELLKNAAKKSGDSVSELVRKLLEYIDLIVNDGETVPVVLKIPVELKDNKEELEKWLDARKEYIMKNL
jgi:uncharacterized protein (DUF1778 family)